MKSRHYSPFHTTARMDTGCHTGHIAALLFPKLSVILYILHIIVSHCHMAAYYTTVLEEEIVVVEALLPQ